MLMATELGHEGFFLIRTTQKKRSVSLMTQNVHEVPAASPMALLMTSRLALLMAVQGLIGHKKILRMVFC